eukprot:3959955-Pleurochrysis_carterae.AAC.1
MRWHALDYYAHCKAMLLVRACSGASNKDAFRRRNGREQRQQLTVENAGHILPVASQLIVSGTSEGQNGNSEEQGSLVATVKG